MSFKVKNTTNTPIHVRVSNAGITYWYKNWLAAGEEHTFDPSAIWFDLTFYYASHDNEISERDNAAPGAGIGVTILGILSMIAGVILMAIPLPGPQPAAAVLIATGATAIAGVVSTIGGIAITIAQNAYLPATIGQIYGANNYEFNVTGGFTLERDPQHPEQFLITGASVIGVDWKNLNQGTSGHQGGAVIPAPQQAVQGRMANPLTAVVSASAGGAAGVSPDIFERNGQQFIRVKVGADQAMV